MACNHTSLEYGDCALAAGHKGVHENLHGAWCGCRSEFIPQTIDAAGISAALPHGGRVSSLSWEEIDRERARVCAQPEPAD
jgi:hypothetical protein